MMIKQLLSLFGIVGKATPEQSEKSYNHLVAALTKRLGSVENYTVVFGYGMKAGMLSTKISCYAIGFSESYEKLAIVPIYADSAEIEDLLLLEKSDIRSISVGMQGEKIIKSDMLNGDLHITVPSYTREDAEDLLQLPIVQMENAAAFEKWIKENF